MYCTDSMQDLPPIQAQLPILSADLILRSDPPTWSGLQSTASHRLFVCFFGGVLARHYWHKVEREKKTGTVRDKIAKLFGSFADRRLYFACMVRLTWLALGGIEASVNGVAVSLEEFGFARSNVIAVAFDPQSADLRLELTVIRYCSKTVGQFQ